MKDFGFYRLEIVDLKTGQRVMSRWANCPFSGIMEMADEMKISVY